MAKINLWAVLVGAVLYMALGFVWYSPALFGPRFTALMTFTPEQVARLGEGMGPSYAAMLVGALVMALVLERLAAWTRAGSAAGGAGLGALVWLAAAVTTGISTVIFESRPLGLYLINGGYHLVAFVLVGALVAGWRKRA
ncbi:MAG TPA: DUF1761 domain-containing protein [Methylomirabilota bacterium]|nr:DUF1761 domain-containing protein [Methylomirabilota bacterium]